MGIDTILQYVIRIILTLAVYIFVSYALIEPLLNLFSPVLYLLFPYSEFVVISHLVKAFMFMLGLWVMSKLLA